MLFEVLKNSLRAVVDKHGVDCDNFPPVKVIVAEGNEDITIKISDEGGGIPRSAVPLVWTFMLVLPLDRVVLPLDRVVLPLDRVVPPHERVLIFLFGDRYTTAAPENLSQDFQGTDFKAPLAGFGQYPFSPFELC